MTTVVYTCILEQYDNLRPPAIEDAESSYICFTDELLRVPPWEIAPVPCYAAAPRERSRIPKILAHLCVDADISIYHDGSLVIAKHPADIIAELLGDADVALYMHPCRRNLIEELDACQRLGIGYDETMRQQVTSYVAAGCTDGLWAGGVVIRRHNQRTRLFNEIWWREFRMGCSRDQIALRWAIHESGISLRTIEHDILLDPERFKFTFHADFDCGDNASFESDRRRRIARRKEIEALCR